jgi:phosphatidylserine/phosphatidylglycerophosphate/cardiolipin synthase-like enzyme
VAKIECNLAFVYWNPVLRRMMGVPDNLEVRVLDHDPVVADDILGAGRTRGGAGHVQIQADTEAGGEAEVEVYFEIMSGGLGIDLETGAFGFASEIPDRRRHLKLPDRWSSKNNFSTTYVRGLFKVSSDLVIGAPDEPLTFVITFDCFLRLVYWNERRSAYMGLPAGIEVEAVDREGVLADRVLARGALDEHGRVHLRLDPDHEPCPDLYFQYRIPDEIPAAVDLDTNALAASGFPIPRAWSSFESFALEDPATRGYWDDFIGYRVGIETNPYVFDVHDGAPKRRAGNLARPLIDGHEVLARLTSLIEAAESSIHIEVMLFFNDPIGRRITDLLVEAARRGVSVRVMFDQKTTAESFRLYTLKSVWARGLLRLSDEERDALLARFKEEEEAEKVRGDTAAIRAALEAAPNARVLDTAFPYVEVRPEAPSDVPEAYRELTARLPFFTMARIDHRKIIVIDGKAALVGGLNIGQEYLYDKPFDPLKDAGEEEWAKWHDVMLEVNGPAVRDLQTLFRERWVEEGGDAFDLGPRELGAGTDPGHPTFPRMEPRLDGLPITIASTTPGARLHIHNEVLGRMAAAERRILVQVPYFTSQEAWSLLEDAARRKVRVLCVFPSDHSDSLEFLYAARLRYRDLLRAGVEVYEYKSHMTHAKVVVADDAAVIGSANLNHAGLFNHYEVAATVEDAGFADALERDLFQRDIGYSRRIEEADIQALTDISPAAKIYIKAFVNVWF